MTVCWVISPMTRLSLLSKEWVLLCQNLPRTPQVLVSVYELHHQVLDLGSPLIGLPRIVEERGSSFERSDLADGGAADSEPGGPNHNDLPRSASIFH